MSRLNLVWLLNEAGPAFDDVIGKAASCLRPDDHLVLVDTTGDIEGRARQGRFIALHNTNEFFGVTHISGIGATEWEALCEIALSAITASPSDRVLFCGPRFKPRADAFHRARRHMEEADHDVLHLTWEDQKAASKGDLFSLIFPLGLLGTLRPFSSGIPKCLWKVESSATRPGSYIEPIGHRGGMYNLHPKIAADTAALLSETLDAAPFVADALQFWIQSSAPAARSNWSRVWHAIGTAYPGAAVPLLGPAPLSAPSSRRGHRAKIWLAGSHAHRSPFAYRSLAPCWANHVQRADTPEAADLIVFSHPSDPFQQDRSTAAAISSGARVALISEEPFWDSMFSPNPFARSVVLPAAHIGEVRATQLNHHTSTMFDWDHLPYYLLAEDGIRRRLEAALAGPIDTADRDVRTAFMAERRPERFHDIDRPEGDLVGLCAWRTRVAEMTSRGQVSRIGASWTGGRTRFELLDWHAEKLADLTGKIEILSAIENTHQPTYVSEKFFDAFACGAAGLYYASPGHSIHRLDVPQEAWLNLYGMSSADAAERIDSWQPDTSAITEARATLSKRFSDHAAISSEYNRFSVALAAELEAILDTPVYGDLTI